MAKLQTPKEIFESLARKGEYEEAHFDKNEIEKRLEMVLEDYEFNKSLSKLENPSWRVIFNAFYDVFRELGDILMNFKHQKISNHQGLFAFIVLNFKDLKFDWEFLEKIRTVRNKNKYLGMDISKHMWKEVEMQFNLYISALKKEIENKLE